MKVDLATVQRIMEEVADAEIMTRFRNLASGDVEMKGVNDPVTIADKAAELALTLRLQDLLPGSVVVGEEGCAADPGILSRFDGETPVWVIDPIDGTRSFVEGRPEFGVMIALMQHKQTVAAWIYDPNTRHTLSAEQGSGVYLQGKKMRLAAHDPSIPKLGIIGARLKDALSDPQVAAVSAALPALAVGAASAFDYGRLFTGDMLFANSVAPRASFLLYRKTKPWDHVPGLFLQAEAKGYSADLFGDAYDVRNGKKGLLIAPDIAAWDSFYNAIKPTLSVIDFD